MGLTSFTSSKPSSYCPPNSSTMLRWRSFFFFFEEPRVPQESLFVDLVSKKELPKSTDFSFFIFLLPDKFLDKTKSTLVLTLKLPDTMESKHRQAQPRASVKDLTAAAPAILWPKTAELLEEFCLLGQIQDHDITENSLVSRYMTLERDNSIPEKVVGELKVEYGTGESFVPCLTHTPTKNEKEKKKSSAWGADFQHKNYPDFLNIFWGPSFSIKTLQ